MEFSAHNIRLDDGTFTKPDSTQSVVEYPWFISARRILETVFPGDKSQLRLADIGCLEGGYAVEFARMGFQVVGIEVRESNIAACNYVKSKTDLPNLQFAWDNALNIAGYGIFDAVFCCGLLHHLDRPKNYLESVSSVTKKLLILQEHFALSESAGTDYGLSEPTENEGLIGRWFTEFVDDEAFDDRDTAKWKSWDNKRSFWIQREYLLQTIFDVGFDLVMEEYSSLGPSIVGCLTSGSYQKTLRGTFVGIKTS
jgi:SAM-dependent methyltransferase